MSKHEEVFPLSDDIIGTKFTIAYAAIVSMASRGDIAASMLVEKHNDVIDALIVVQEEQPRDEQEEYRLRVQLGLIIILIRRYHRLTIESKEVD